MAASELTKIIARASWVLGSHGVTFDDTISDDRFTQEEFRRAALETESEIVRVMCEYGHPMREQFRDWSADLANGDPIPARLGKVEAVRIKKHAAGGYEMAEAASRGNIRAWRENLSSMFDAIAHDQDGSSLSGYFDITNDVVEFTGSAAQVLTCTHTPDYATPALQLEDIFDDVLVVGTITRLNKLGVPQALMSTYGSLYQSALQNIRQGQMAFPELEEVQENE